MAIQSLEVEREAERKSIREHLKDVEFRTEVLPYCKSGKHPEKYEMEFIEAMPKQAGDVQGCGFEEWRCPECKKHYFIPIWKFWGDE